MIAVFLALCTGVVLGWFVQRWYAALAFRKRWGLTQPMRLYSRRPIRYRRRNLGGRANRTVIRSWRHSRLFRLFDRLNEDELFSR
jgi:hypothetical protein